MALDVIGAGLGRTGTLSLKTALEQLGFGPCHHMFEVIQNPAQIPSWDRAADGEPIDWEALLGNYRSTVDWPACHFWAELANRYPQARVILSLRDPQRWYESMAETIFRTMLDQGVAPDMPRDHPMHFIGTIVARKTFGFDFSKDNVIAAFERHNAEVRSRIPAGRLLEFEVSQGWEPLCAFLGVPVPETPFPHVNDRQAFQQQSRRFDGTDGDAGPE